MKIKMEDGYLYIIEANARQTAALKSWQQLKWDEKMQWWKGVISLELLDKLSSLIPLPEAIRKERRRLAVDAERVKAAEEVKPLVCYPVKKKLYTHQIRASNMCLMTFDLVPPQKGKMHEQTDRFA